MTEKSEKVKKKLERPPKWNIIIDQTAKKKENKMPCLFIKNERERRPKTCMQNCISVTKGWLCVDQGEDCCVSQGEGSVLLKTQPKNPNPCSPSPTPTPPTSLCGIPGGSQAND